MAEGEDFYRAAERRIEIFTVVVGAAASLAAALAWSRRGAAGVAIGAGLSWLNYRWLKQGVAGLARLSTVPAGAEKVHVPRSVYAKLTGRYALLAVAAYVILTLCSLPLVALLCGLFALAGGVLLELMYELVGGRRVRQAG